MYLGWLLGGCYAPTPSPGAQCSPQGLCPEPLQCIAGTCQVAGTNSPADAPPPVDGRAPDAPLVCPADFTQTPFGSCQRAVNFAKPWLDAEQSCELEGAHLIVVDSAAEAASLPSPAWIGISDRVTEGTYRAVTGPVITFRNFGVGQPSGGTISNCIHVADATKTWADGPCSFPFPYVCEYDGVPADHTAY